MPTIFSPEELRARFIGTKRSAAWYDQVLLYHRLKVHADGDLPIHLIKKARPNESEEVRAYRQNIYEPETVNPIERVIGVLEKIRRSPDWMIRFNEEVPKIISKDETLERYISENYPVYESLENWLFEEALRNIALDANAIVVVMPRDLEVAGDKFMQPIAQVYNSHSIIDFAPGDYAIVKSDEYSSLLTPDEQNQRATAEKLTLAHPMMLYNNNAISPIELPYKILSQVYYNVNTYTYEKWEETPDGKYQLTARLLHGLDGLPVFQLPGKFVKRMGSSIVKKTPLSPMVPHLNKAARESNDLDAGVIMHLYPEKWRINNTPCPDCGGAGKTIVNGKPEICQSCKGQGIDNKPSPFNEVVIKPAALGESNIPTPPLGYVQKDTRIIELQDQRIRDHIQKALAAINMDHLGETQLNQSGTAKQFDRDEVNNLIYSFAESLCYVANAATYWINEIRYKNLVQDFETRRRLLPVIPVPEKFDVINTTFLLQEYQMAKTAGLNAVILAELQKEIGQKKFYANPAVAKTVQTIMELDPFPEKTIEEKSLLEAQQLATKADVILSNYISDFVSRAIEDDLNFLEKTKTQKREILLKYATEKVNLLNAAKTLSQDILQPDAAQVAAQNTMTAFNKDTAMMARVQNAKV